MKLDLKAPLLDKFDFPKGHKENDTEYWNHFFHDDHEDKMKKIDTLSDKIDELLKENNKCKL